MRSVGVREFRDRATQIMAGSETLVIERRGVPIGFYVPIATIDRSIGDKALTELGKVVEEVLALTSLSEEKAVHELTAEAAEAWSGR